MCTEYLELFIKSCWLFWWFRDRFTFFLIIFQLISDKWMCFRFHNIVLTTKTLFCKLESLSVPKFCGLFWFQYYKPFKAQYRWKQYRNDWYGRFIKMDIEWRYEVEGPKWVSGSQKEFVNERKNFWPCNFTFSG